MNEKYHNTPLQGPGALALLTLMAGPHISFYPAFRVVRRLNAGIGLKSILVISGILFPVLYFFIVMWKVEWYWASLAMVGANGLAAALYWFLFRSLKKANQEQYTTHVSPARLQEKKYILAGMLGGAGFIPLLGIPLTLIFLVGSDRLLQNLMPLAFDDTVSLLLLVIALFSLGLTGLIGGGWAGRIGFKADPLPTLLHGLWLVLISLTWFFLLILFTMLPGFIADAANISMGLIMLHFVGGTICISSWWSPCIMMYSLKPSTLRARLGNMLFTPIICLGSVLVFAIVTGYPADWFHSAGKYYEKRGEMAAAIRYYQYGLAKKPTGPHAGYLHYRIALGQHKLGKTEKAVQGLRKIVSIYNYDQDLAYKANRFLDSLERNSDGRRVVLPGVDNPTAYKDAYCVPNSLALVMNFWGSDIDAGEIGRAITSIGGGTITVDQTWFAHQNGFQHQFIPMASIDDIKMAIDAGFPVMVYVPRHVFVIVGYDERLESLVTYDVATRDVWVEYLEKDFIRSWKKENSTMILAYPDEAESKLPEHLAGLIRERSDAYFQYHLHLLQTGGLDRRIDHLHKAVETSTDYFFPLASMYTRLPSARGRINVLFDVELIVQSINHYFGSDFDEGMHLAGQYHDSDYAYKDKDLQASLAFLAGTGRLEAARDLITTIQSNGIVSDETQEILAMLNLAMGNFERAVPQLEELDDGQLHFYLAQGHLKQDSLWQALPSLVKTIDDCT